MQRRTALLAALGSVAALARSAAAFAVAPAASGAAVIACKVTGERFRSRPYRAANFTMVEAGSGHTGRRVHR